MSPDQVTTRNRLLALMSASDFARLASSLEWVELSKGSVIASTNGVIEHAYFLESGIGSIIVTSPEGFEVEAGLFGREGVSPADLVLGSETAPNRITMQVGGQGWRITSADLVDALGASASLRAVLLRYVQALVQQTSHTALSNGVHQIEERLARWLLMCDDRSDGGELPLTHEFIAIMLAVRRPSVTTALHVLEGNRFIRLERGCIIIGDRHGLEAFAGDSYGKPEAEYERLIGPLRPPVAAG